MNAFQIQRQLGSGSFGRVLQVKSSTKGQILAMKQVKMSNLSPKQKDNALNEVRLLASIDSPHVIAYKTAFFQEQGNLLCIIMQFADGGDLAGIVKKKKDRGERVSEEFIWKVAYDLLTGLKVLHESNIIHRDIKPANIFFASGHSKIGDLNVSKVMDGKFASTQTGTPYYTSPQIWNNYKYDGRIDIWSLGCVLYQLAALRPPFNGKDLPGLSKRIISGVFDSLPFPYTKKLNDFIRKCLSVRMSERPNAKTLLKDEIFEELKSKEEEGDVELLDTIKCPKILKNLHNKLPQGKPVKLTMVKSHKKLASCKNIQSQCLDKQKQRKALKSLKKLPSENCININSPMKNQKLSEFQSSLVEPSAVRQAIKQLKKQLRPPNQSKQNEAMGAVAHSPNGYVKLPRIGSQRSIL